MRNTRLPYVEVIEMKKEMIQLTELYIRQSIEMLEEADRIGLEPGFLTIAHSEYLTKIRTCIDNIRALDPNREILFVSGENWPFTFVVSLEEGREKENVRSE